MTDQALALRLHREMFRLRLSEFALAAEYRKQEMRTPTHFGVGQEAVAVGVCAALTKDDAVYSHHRCHNHYLARGGSLKALAAELYGRDGGCSGGRGGSVHLTAREHGFIASSAILGQSIALATGSALAFKMDKAERVAVAFFGEGAGDEGAVWEAFNYASLNRLPVIYVCENNIYGTETKQPATTELYKRAYAFGLGSAEVDGNDVLAVYEKAKTARQAALDGRPVFLECRTYRHLEHVGPNTDHESGRTYRTKAELDQWMDRDPLRLALSHEEEAAIRREVEIDIAAAQMSPFPTGLMLNVW